MIRLLTYNVSWEAMMGKKSGSADGTKCVPAGVCRRNVLSLLSPDYDFICLQEASIGDKNPLAETHELVKYRDGMEDMITLHKKSYKLQETITGNFREAGRPFLVCIFDGIVVVNVHPPQNSPQNMSILESSVPKEKLAGKPIIIAGDFNTDLPQTVRGFGRTFTTERALQHVPTCCDSQLGTDSAPDTEPVRLSDGKPRFRHVYDHILLDENLTFVSADVVKTPTNNKLHSDHLPVQAEIQPAKMGASRKTTRRRRRKSRRRNRRFFQNGFAPVYSISTHGDRI